MTYRPLPRTASAFILLALASVPLQSLAAEGFRLRQSMAGTLGAEMASFSQKPGLFVTGVLAQTEVDGVAGDDGNDLTVSARTVPLPTAAATGGAIPNGRFALQLPTGQVSLKHHQTQLNLAVGYITHPSYAGGSLVFRAVLPVIRQSRHFEASQALGVVSPVPAAPLPLAAIAAVNGAAGAVNAQVQAGLRATSASNNQDTEGLGDLEIDAAWLRTFDQLNVAVGVSMQLPTGDYNPSRGPNPGFGDFRTVQTGGQVSYEINGFTFGARAAAGSNSTNRATAYHTGNFASLEGGVMKTDGVWQYGLSALAVRQLSDDKANGAVVASSRYRNKSAGPFISYRPQGMGFAVHAALTETFAGRNALRSRTLQFRVVRAWD